MVESPNANVALTFEQLQQIEVTKGILRNLEAETAIATKNLSILQKEVVKATKEREYQEELCTSLSVEMGKKEVEKSSLESSMLQIANALEISKTERTRIEKEILDQEEDIRTRELSLKEREDKHSSLHEELLAEARNLELDRNAIEKAKEAFERAVLAVNW